MFSSVAVRLAVAVFAVVAVGLLGGIMVGTGMSASTARLLPEAAWTLSFQKEDALFSKVMPPVFILTVLGLGAAAVLARGSARAWFSAAAVLALLALVVTVRGEVPINQQIQGWTAGAAPAIWMELRDRWFRIHLVRTISAMLAFLCSTTGLALLRREL